MTIAIDLAPVRHRLSGVVPDIEWPTLADDIEAIERLKRQHDAVILAHNYMTPRCSTVSPTSPATRSRSRARHRT